VRTIINTAKVMLGLGALVAMLHLGGLTAQHPLIQFVQVTGNCMEPTLQAGDRALFVHRSWKPGSIVLADVGEDEPVIKRIGAITLNGYVYLCGDNTKASQTYWVPSGQIQSVMLCRIPIRLPMARVHASPNLLGPVRANTERNAVPNTHTATDGEGPCQSGRPRLREISLLNRTIKPGSVKLAQSH